MPALLDRLRKRKLVQWGLAYLAGAWVVLQGLDLLADAWDLSSATVRIVQVLAVLGLLVTLVLAWYHGERGRQRVSALELLVLAVLLAVAGASVMLMREDPGGSSLLELAAENALQVVVLPPGGTAGADTATSPELVQQLLSMELQRRRGIVVIDPLSVNTLVRGEGERPEGDDLSRLRAAGIEYAVRVTLAPAAPGSEIVALLTRVATGEVLETSRIEVRGVTELQDAIERTATRLMRALDEASGGTTKAADLEPFLRSRRPDLAATREFLQGIEYSYQMLPGGSRHFERAVELDPTFIAPRVWLVSGYVSRGDTAAAAAHVQALHALEGRATPFERALIGWADAFARGDLESRAHHLQVALSYSPRNNVLIFDLGTTLYTLGRFAEAVSVVQPAVESRWRFSPLYVLWAMASIESGKAEGLRAPLEAALDITPQYSYIYAVLAGLAEYDGDPEAAQRFADEFAQRLAQNPNAPTQLAEVYESLAEIARVRGDRERARRLLVRAVDADPRRALARLALARVSVESGEVEDAQVQYLAARDSAETDAAAQYLMGEVAALLGREEEAARFLGRYLESLPRGPDAAKARARLRSLSR